MKKTLLIVLIIAMAMGTVFAQGAKEDASSNKPVELTALISLSVPIDGVAAVVAAAEKKMNIKVNIEIRPGGNLGDSIIKTRLASGDMADIFIYNSGSLFQALDPEENFVDLSGEPFVSRLDDTFKSTVTANGKVYGVPYASTKAGAWMYNKKVFARLGLTPPQTWAELMEDCSKIQAAGITPIIGSYKDAWTSQLIVLSDEYNVLQTEPNFPEEFTNGTAKFATTKAALRSWEKLYQSNKYLNKDYLATTYDNALEMLVNGEGAMYPMLTNALEYIYQLYPEQINDIGVFAQPGDDSSVKPGLTIWMPDALYIAKGGKHIDLVKKFYDFYISDEGLAIYMAAIKPNGPYPIKNVKLPEDSYDAVFEMQQYFDEGRTAPALEFQSPLKGSSSEQITVQCGSNMKSALESAAAYDKDVRKQAIQLGLPGWN